MKKKFIKYICQSCGASFSSWMGKCSSCDEWNTITEQLDTASIQSPNGRKLQAISAEDIELNTDTFARLQSGMTEVDTVLGGGFVPGGVVLIAGQPGIGKSTLLLQIAYNVSAKHKVLYVSGEESTTQIGLRAERLGARRPNLMIASSGSANDIAQTILSKDYDFVIVDSIQTVNVDEVSSMAGSTSQITNSTQVLMNAAKTTNTALLIVGHVTKEGSIAGPKVLEHVVDVVLQLEGDRYGGFKMLRTVKNRFGSTNESAIFEMLEQGLVPVDNPSAALLEERRVSDGSVVLATVEGARPLLVEVQALVNTSNYGYPKRTASGIDLNRVNLLIAMLEKRTKLNLSDKDIYINIVGGIKANEPAADLAVCMAIASASKGMQLKEDLVVFGELGLSGEVRRVNFMDKRLAEAKKLGFKGAIMPKQKSDSKDESVYAVTDIKMALNQFLSK
ncbi:DNA repair protein RadA [Candidatus Saccharibacteria bacterium]|nr:DNA repair protein RadA [Candidatus Saccharibacteria bacterium]